PVIINSTAPDLINKENHSGNLVPDLCLFAFVAHLSEYLNEKYPYRIKPIPIIINIARSFLKH
ncbi:MAG: hypothetical protein L0I88_06860, partial [Alkalibacterium sp.]|nr:hypothetical protein [Alkalibacterium sp.]